MAGPRDGWGICHMGVSFGLDGKGCTDGYGGGGDLFHEGLVVRARGGKDGAHAHLQLR